MHVSTPEFTLLQLADRLTEEELLKLAYELCGAYTLAFRNLRASSRCLPLTTADALRRFAGRARDATGIVSLRHALRFVADRSASPTETAVAALLCSSRTRGGYGLPLPELNHIIDVPFKLQELAGQARIVCDAYWPRTGYVVEYDGRVGHSGDANVAKDYARGNALTALGIPAMTLTYRELYHAGRFDRAAWQIAAALGVRLRRDRGFGRAWELKRGTLRRTFLRAEDPWRMESTGPGTR